MSDIGNQFKDEKLSEPAYVEVWKEDANIMGFVFCVGEFSLYILRSRPYQRIRDRVVRNNIRPWLMGRVTFKKKILLENPGSPGITIRDIHGGKNKLRSVTVWINGRRKNAEELMKNEVSTQRKTIKQKIVVTTAPILEQIFQICSMKIKMEIILSSEGPVQRITVEGLKKSSFNLNYRFISLFPKNATEYYGHDKNDKPFGGSLREPSIGKNATTVVLPQVQWLVLYNPCNQFGTLIYSPDFNNRKPVHLLVVDRRQDLKVFHVSGNCEYIPGMQYLPELSGLKVDSCHRQQLTLLTRPIEAGWIHPVDREIGVHRTPIFVWKEKAVEEINKLKKLF